VTTSTQAAGQALFRLRSLTPVPVVALASFLVWRGAGQAGLGGPAVDSVLDACGLAFALAGQALRFYTLGWVPEGTSGQNLTLQASTLNTRGPYAWVRNPLYLGNLGITLGLLCMANLGLVYLLGLSFFFGEYFFIIRAEESFLRERFGAAFEVYRVSVPRWLPRLAPASEGALRHGAFDWQRALKKEINPFSAWAAGALCLQGWELWSRRTTTLPALVGLTVSLGLVGLALLGVKAWKKGWLRA
jgi:protein-S-isoprenylcysteine O-methyltransferase Ste14